MNNGLAHIRDTFTRAHHENRAVLMPYFTIGFPTLEKSAAILHSIADSGADLIELGVPFSDPLADGPTIQHSTQIALEAGTSVSGCLEVVRELRQRGVTQPLILMGYYNPILAYGVSNYVQAAAEAGADGFIVPDLPPEEAHELEQACREFGLALVFMLAPTSTPDRISMVTSRASGFIYLVSLTGVTGARNALPVDLADFIQRVKIKAHVPLAVGFGISTPEQVRQVGSQVDGVIVGSALISAVDGAPDPSQAAGEFVRRLKDSLIH
jgi:tryptophan synthase alpha chain